MTGAYTVNGTTITIPMTLGRRTTPIHIAFEVDGSTVTYSISGANPGPLCRRLTPAVATDLAAALVQAVACGYEHGTPLEVGERAYDFRLVSVDGTPTPRVVATFDGSDRVIMENFPPVPSHLPLDAMRALNTAFGLGADCALISAISA